MQLLTPAIQAQLLAMLRAGHTVMVNWDCGGDESFVYTTIDGVAQEPDYEATDNLAVELDRYLTELLALPSVGEFSMRGGGQIFQAGADIVLEYQSEAEVYEGEYDESWEDDFTDEQLAEMGITRKVADEPAAEPGSVPPPLPADEAPAAADESDAEMSAEYSGHRVLFRVE